jgi:hypothetical protein
MQRQSFIYKSQSTDRPLWRFDFSLVWSGATKAEAEQNQVNNPPQCEVECECLDLSYAMDQLGRDERYMAMDLLLKSTDLIRTLRSKTNTVGQNDFTLVPLLPCAK